MSDAGRAPDTADFNPDFAPRLAALRAALTKQGIQTSILSGYRSPEYQNEMYQNHLAKLAHRPIPYPQSETPGVVAPPWTSYHNYGLATDLATPNYADFAKIRALAPQYGLAGLGAYDPGHIQMAGSLASDVAQYHLAGWRPESQPAPAANAIAYDGPAAAPGTTLTSNQMKNPSVQAREPPPLTSNQMDPSAQARGSVVNPPPPPDGSTRVAAAPPAADPNARPTTLQGWADKLLTKPLTKDAQGNDVHGQSPLEKLADAFKPSSDGRAAPQAPAAPMMMAQDPDPGLAPAAAQMFQAVQQSAAAPLSWSSTPYGSKAGQQYGMTLNATGGPYG